MRHWVTYPMVSHPCPAELVSGQALTRFATTAEVAGFDGIGFTDHPAPSHRWLLAGGHDTLDPFAALAFVAAATERIRLIPNIVVLPYRNPFLVAKSAASLDVLSGGRFTLSVATGYLRSEFRALGVDFERRNQLFDEALDVLAGIWSTDDFSYEGTGFSASGQTANPKPGHIPIWIGGNSARSRQRVAEVGDAWNPFRAPAGLAGTARTQRLETVEDLARMLDDLWRRVDAAGRDPATIDVSFGSFAGRTPGTDDFDADACLAELDRLGGLGVTWAAVAVAGESLAQALEALEAYGEQVIRAT